ncbi:hypothetical protein KIW84_014385 [Lathyrus oleraceus]|uniref:Uncharacterized protein n=1 Tax=Pisum sativum TaxID=3888 RepID=A0A9D5GZ22_PEA|nr:hypothetical protein KIW84_014385 [Pisum sativum]
MIGVKGDLSRKEGHAHMTESTNGDNLKKVQLNLSEVENVKPLLGGNINKEDESLLLPNLTLGPEVEVETSSDNVGTKLDSEKDENFETHVRYGKNLVYKRTKTIPESIHIEEFDLTLHGVNFVSP